MVVKHRASRAERNIRIEGEKGGNFECILPTYRWALRVKKKYGPIEQDGGNVNRSEGRIESDKPVWTT